MSITMKLSKTSKALKSVLIAGLAFVSIGALASPTITMKEHNEGYRLVACAIYSDPTHAKCDREFRSPLPLEVYVRKEYGDYEVVEYGVEYRKHEPKIHY